MFQSYDPFNAACIGPFQKPVSKKIVDTNHKRLLISGNHFAALLIT